MRKKGPSTRRIGEKMMAQRDMKKILGQFILPSYIEGQPVGLIGLKCE